MRQGRIMRFEYNRMTVKYTTISHTANMDMKKMKHAINKIKFIQCT